jgi:hypothetical protein
MPLTEEEVLTATEPVVFALLQDDVIVGWTRVRPAAGAVVAYHESDPVIVAFAERVAAARAAHVAARQDVAARDAMIRRKLVQALGEGSEAERLATIEAILKQAEG